MRVHSHKVLRTVAVSALSLALSFASPHAASAAETTTSLVKRVSSTGLGCKKIVKSEAILFGKRVTCLIGAERVSIEVFAAKDFRKATSLACSFGVRFIAVTDNKTWTIVPGSRTTANALGKALRAQTRTFCAKGDIINETAGSTETPAPESSPKPVPSAPFKGTFTNPYVLGDIFRIGDLEIQLAFQVPDATAAVCASVQGESIVPKLCRAEYDSNFKPVVSVDSASTDRYVQWTLRITNKGNDIVRPDNDLLVQMTNPAGALQYQDVAVFWSNSLINWDVSLVPGGTSASNVFFTIAKTVDVAPLRLVIRSTKFAISTTAYIKAS